MRKHLLLTLIAAMSAVKFYSQNITWANDIAPILYNNCTSCHHPGGAAPNSLITYNDAYNYRFMIKAYVESGYMPPWPPDAQYKHLAFERILSSSDKAKISNWVLGGGQQGNPGSAPAPPTYTNNATQLSSVDFSGKMQDYMVNTSTDLYRCFIIHTNYATDKYISEIEVKPGDPSIVHHVLVFEDTTQTVVSKDSADAGTGYTSFSGTGSNDSKLVGEWVPGTAPITLPAGMGIKLRKNTRIILQIHYPGGTFMKLDSTRVNIKFASSNPREVFLAPILNENNIVNGPFVIPANTIKTFKQQYTNAYPLAFTLLSTAPHMHLVGKKYKVYTINSNNDTTPLIYIPNWDFKWQGIYSFRNPIKIPAGAKIIGETEYDNTSANPYNPNNPPQTVTFGESTTEEMMQTYFAFLVYQNGDENIVVDNSPIVGLNEMSNQIVKTIQFYSIIPNPANSNAKISYFSPQAEKIKMSVVSSEGKLVKQWNDEVLPGFGELNIQLSGLSKGQYFVSLETATYKRTKPLIIND